MIPKIIMQQFNEIKNTIYDKLLDVYEENEEYRISIMENFYNQVQEYNDILYNILDENKEVNIDKLMKDIIKIANEFKDEKMKEYCNHVLELSTNTLNVNTDIMRDFMLRIMRPKSKEYTMSKADSNKFKFLCNNLLISSNSFITKNIIKLFTGNIASTINYILNDAFNSCYISPKVLGDYIIVYNRLSETSINEDIDFREFLNLLISGSMTIEENEEGDYAIYASKEFVESNVSKSIINIESIEDIDNNINKDYKALSSKELIEIANSKGYVLKRQKGDHGMFINNKGKLVVIPVNRELGKGLQIKILKMLNE